MTTNDPRDVVIQAIRDRIRRHNAACRKAGGAYCHDDFCTTFRPLVRELDDYLRTPTRPTAAHPNPLHALQADEDAACALKDPRP